MSQIVTLLNFRTYPTLERPNTANATPVPHPRVRARLTEYRPIENLPYGLGWKWWHE